MRSDGVDDAVGAHFLGVVREDGDACLGAGLDDDGRDIGVVGRQHLAHLAQGCGHCGAQRDAGDRGFVREESAEDEGDLIRRRTRIGLDPPRAHEIIALEEPEDGVGVADIDSEQRHSVSRRSAPMSRTGAECVKAPTAT